MEGKFRSHKRHVLISNRYEAKTIKKSDLSRERYSVDIPLDFAIVCDG